MPHVCRLFVFVLLFAILACDQPNAVNDVVSAYFDAKKRGDFATVYELLSTEDQAFTSKKEYVKTSTEGFSLAKAFAQSIDFKILEVDIQGKKAAAKVEYTHPNMSAMMGVFLANALGGNGKNNKKIQSAVAKKFASGNIPTSKTIIFQNLVKEGGRWRVYEGKKVKSGAEELMKTAENLTENKKFDAALKKYNEVLALDSAIVESQQSKARKKKVDIKNQIEEEKEKNAYVNQVILYDFVAKYFNTYSKKRVPGVEFKIRNKGKRALKEVEVTVYFKDSTGNIIFEENFYPVYTGRISFSGNNKPLKAGYIWQLERGKFYTVKSLPSEWKEGAAVARITDIEFMD